MSSAETAAPPLNRRTFVQAGAAALLTAASYERVWGANARVGVGFIGFGLIGKRHVLDFVEQPDVSPVAVAEVHRGRLDEARALIGGPVQGHGDFRKLLDQRDVDAVVVSTPDHWHTLMTLLACDAGKDVYVEKPLTLFVREGRWMLEVAKRTKRVIQVGTQNRSGPPFQKARELIRQGRLGQIVSASNNNSRNVMPGFGNPPDGPPPPDLDYDMWLGPAPKRPYNPNRSIYHFRWFWDYSGGQATNLGQHSLDVVHWCVDMKGPVAVSSVGGRFFLRDNGEVPDVQDTIIEYPGFQAVVQFHECASGGMTTGMGGLSFHGNRGTMVLGRDGY